MDTFSLNSHNWIWSQSNFIKQAGIFSCILKQQERLVRGRRDPHRPRVPRVGGVMPGELVVVGGPRVRWDSLEGHLFSLVRHLCPRHLLVEDGHLRDSKWGPHSGPRDVIWVPVWGRGYHGGHCQLAPLARVHLGVEKHALKWTKRKEWRKRRTMNKIGFRGNEKGWNEKEKN